MRQGMDAKLVLSKKGNLIAIATGSDACAEHESGAKSLLSALCDQYNQEATVLPQLKAAYAAGSDLSAISYPQMLEAKRILRNPAELQFIEVEGPEPEGYFGYARGLLTNYKNDLRFAESSRFRDADVAGAWDAQSFAIRVRGKNYVKKLKAFYQDVLEGQAVFAGNFLPDEAGRLAGVIIASERYLTGEALQNVKTAQAKYERNLRLKARDDSNEIHRRVRELTGGPVGFVWALWKDATESEVVYGLNPAFGVKADYLGPYTKEQLLNWAQAKCAYHLKPVVARAA